MSEDSKRYRAAMKAKAQRLGGSGDPHQKVDASSWEPPPLMNTEAPTGPRPVSKRRNYKAGGHVAGAEAHKHAGRKPRKAGGKALVDDLLNADVKEANESREGIKHEGGMKRGGRARRGLGGGLGGIMGLIPALAFQGGDKDDGPAPYSPGAPGQAAGKKRGGRAKRDLGGPLAGAISQGIGGQGRMNFSYPGAKSPAQALGIKTGGRAKRAGGGEAPKPVPAGARQGYNAEAVNKAIAASNRSGQKIGGREAARIHALLKGPYKEGGKVERASGGRLYKEQFANEDGGRQPRKSGGKLDAAERRELPKSDFGMPGSRKYPMPDKGHAKAAKSRASEMEHKGRISKSTEEKIDAKADRVLARKDGGRAGKGKMSVNIVIAPGGAHPQAAAPPPMPAGPPPMPLPPRPAMPPPGMAAPPGMPPPSMPPGAPPPMMGRKAGGLVDGGAGGGLGRLEKIRDYGDRAYDAEERR